MGVRTAAAEETVAEVGDAHDFFGARALAERPGVVGAVQVVVMGGGAGAAERAGGRVRGRRAEGRSRSQEGGQLATMDVLGAGAMGR